MSMKSDINLEHFKGHEDLIKRVDDLLWQYDKHKKAKLTPFLRPNQQKAISKYLGNKYEYYFDGGFDDSELKRLVIGDGNSEVVCTYANIFSKNIKIEHRDLLGAIMNCGLERNQFGDVFLKDDLAIVYCTYESAKYLVSNLTQINRLNVEFKISETNIEPNYNIDEFTKSVNSYRLDSLVSAICNISRNKASDLIKADRVAVNFDTIEECDYLCDNGDTISVRQYGRFKVLEFLSKTRKDRNLVKFGKYL